MPHRMVSKVCQKLPIYVNFPQLCLKGQNFSSTTYKRYQESTIGPYTYILYKPPSPQPSSTFCMARMQTLARLPTCRGRTISRTYTTTCPPPPWLRLWMVGTLFLLVYIFSFCSQCFEPFSFSAFYCIQIPTLYMRLCDKTGITLVHVWVPE